MATRLKEIKTDLKKEVEGIWDTYPGTDFRCRIARSGNQNFEQHSKRLRKNAKIKRAAAGELTDKESKLAIAPAVAEFVLLDWEGLEDDDGNQIPYSVTKAVELLSDRAMDDFYNWVLKTSNNGEKFKHDLEEESLGNSGPASTGS